MITVLDAETAVEGGVLIWRLLLQVDDARIVYKFPAYTFEARVAEYGITDPDELLTTVLLEWLDDSEPQVNPYTVDEQTAGEQKRAATARLADSHQVTFAADPSKGSLSGYMREHMRLDQRNIVALHAQVEMSRSVHVRRARAMASDNRAHVDQAGALVPALEAVAKEQRQSEADQTLLSSPIG